MEVVNGATVDGANALIVLLFISSENWNFSENCFGYVSIREGNMRR